MKKNPLRSAAFHLCMACITTLLVFPIIWMLKVSITPRESIFILPPTWFTIINIQGYVDILTSGFLIYFRNSLLVAVGTVFISLFAGSFAAYSFSRFSYKGRQTLMLITLSAQMFPWALLLISLYLFFAQVHLIDTLWAVMIAHTTFALPMTIWILKGYFDTISTSLEEAAYIDGCSRMRTFAQIILPLTAPGIISAGIYVFIFSWNDFLFGLTLTISDIKRTLAPGISMAFIGEFEYRWGEMMSAATAITLPILIVFLFLQKAFVDGMTAGAIKE